MKLADQIPDKRRLAVVYPRPEFQKDARFGYSVECLTLATLAKERGFLTRYFDFSILDEEAEFLSCLSAGEVGDIIVVYFDSVPLHRSNNVAHGLSLCAKIKRSNPHALVIACGPWCMVHPIECKAIDCVWSEEPELCFLRDFCNQHPRVVAGSKLLADISILPCPDRHLLPSLKEIELHNHLLKSAVVQTTRGCCNGCRFCPRQAWTGRLVRHRPLDSCVDELRKLVDGGVRNVWIDDDNMGADPSWSNAFFDLVGREVHCDRQMGLFFSTDVNVEAGIFRRARNAGARIVSFGIESASGRIQEYFRKPITVGKVVRAVSAADAAGLYTVGNFIVGAPIEDESDILATKDLISRIPLDAINVKILSIVQGAPLWRDLCGEGKIKPETLCDFMCKENGTSPHQMNELKERQNFLYESFLKIGPLDCCKK